MADEQPLQAHLRNKSAKKLNARGSGTAQCQTNWHPAVRILEWPWPHKQRELTVNKLTFEIINLSNRYDVSI